MRNGERSDESEYGLGGRVCAVGELRKAHKPHRSESSLLEYNSPSVPSYCNRDRTIEVVRRWLRREGRDYSRSSLTGFLGEVIAWNYVGPYILPDVGELLWQCLNPFNFSQILNIFVSGSNFRVVVTIFMNDEREQGAPFDICVAQVNGLTNPPPEFYEGDGWDEWSDPFGDNGERLRILSKETIPTHFVNELEEPNNNLDVIAFIEVKSTVERRFKAEFSENQVAFARKFTGQFGVMLLDNLPRIRDDPSRSASELILEALLRARVRILFVPKLPPSLWNNKMDGLEVNTISSSVEFIFDEKSNSKGYLFGLVNPRLDEPFRWVEEMEKFK